jgi:hypothetical protein
MKQTPKEKAKELKDKFSVHLRFFDEYSGWVDYTDSSHAKQFALVAVDEILNHHQQEQGLYVIDKYFWLQVKKEIENL